MRIFNILGNTEQEPLVQAIGHKEFTAEGGAEHTCLQVADDVEERVFDKHRKTVLAVNLDVFAIEKS